MKGIERSFMKDIVIYSLVHCPYCVRAKDLLNRHGIPYNEILAEDLPRDEVENLFSRSKMRTFPQIFAGNELVGGFTELKKLDDEIGIKKFLNK